MMSTQEVKINIAHPRFWKKYYSFNNINTFGMEILIDLKFVNKVSIIYIN